MVDLSPRMYCIGLIATAVSGAISYSILEYNDHPSTYSIIKGVGLGALCGVALFSTLENLVREGVNSRRNEKEQKE